MVGQTGLDWIGGLLDFWIVEEGAVFWFEAV